MHVESGAESSEYESETNVEEFKTSDDLIEMLLARAEAQIAANLANNTQQTVQPNPTIAATVNHATQTTNTTPPVMENNETTNNDEIPPSREGEDSDADAEE